MSKLNNFSKITNDYDNVISAPLGVSPTLEKILCEHETEVKEPDKMDDFLTRFMMVVTSSKLNELEGNVTELFEQELMSLKFPPKFIQIMIEKISSGTETINTILSMIDIFTNVGGEPDES